MAVWSGNGQVKGKKESKKTKNVKNLNWISLDWMSLDPGILGLWKIYIFKSKSKI